MSKGRDTKPHIGIFGRRNNGKSSLINALAGQEIAIVSDVAGTTTDPVKKSMEIFGIGPAILIDTAGIDDIGELGQKRIKKTIEALKTVDLAILVIAENRFEQEERKIIETFNEYAVPFFVIHNKSDQEEISEEVRKSIEKEFNTSVLDYSIPQHKSNDEIIGIIKKYMPETAYKSRTIIGDIINKGDVVLLIAPIDSEAPEGRLILSPILKGLSTMIIKPASSGDYYVQIVI